MNIISFKNDKPKYLYLEHHKIVSMFNLLKCIAICFCSMKYDIKVYEKVQET